MNPPESNSTERDRLAAILSELSDCLAAVATESVQAAVDRVANAQRVFVAGAGRSRLAMRGFAMRLMHLGKAAYVVGETTTPAIAAGDLLVVGSGSGRTKSLVAFAETAKKLGVPILLITIDSQSPLGDLADHAVQIPAYSPRIPDSTPSIQPLGSLFEQSLFILMDYLVLLILEREGHRESDMGQRHANLE